MAWGFVGPSVAIIVALTAFPAVWSVLLSFQRWDGIGDARFTALRNYSRLVSDADFYAALRHTALFTVIYVPVSILGGLVVAALLAKPIALGAFYRTAIFVPFVASAAATGILANYIFDKNAGIINNALAGLGLARQGFLEDPRQAILVIVTIALWGGLGFNVVVYLAAMQDVPPHLEEAARLDGASSLQVFRHITFPHLRPVTVFVGVWQTVVALQLFDIVYTTTRGGPIGATRTIVYYVYRNAFELADFGQGSAGAIVLFVVTMVLTAGMMAYSWRRNVEAF